MRSTVAMLIAYLLSQKFTGRGSAQGIGDLRVLPAGGAGAGQRCYQHQQAGEPAESGKRAVAHGASSSVLIRMTSGHPIR